MTWGSRVTFEVSSANPDDTPVWVDLSAYVLHEQGLGLAVGRQDNLDQTQPSSLTFTLNNNDDRFTYGNTSSPYASWWGPGRKCRLRETYGSTVFDLFTGYLQVPQETVPTSPTPSGTGRGQAVSVTAVDRLARLAAAPTFLPNLGAHILGQTSATLSAYWPMNDPAGGAIAATSSVSGIGPLLQVTSYNDAATFNQLLFAERAGPPGDDGSYVQLNPTDAVIANNYNGAPRMARRDFNISLTSGTVLAFLLWIYVPSATAVYPGQILVSHANSFNPPSVTISGVSTTGWTATFFDASHGAFSATTSAIRTIGWSFLGVFLDVDASTLTLRADGLSATTAGGGLALSGTFQEVALDGIEDQSFAHLQIVSGSSSVLNQAFFDAQRQIGLTGLERQTTGDRIRTIAAYAGIPTAEYTDTVDKGTAIMQAASLAEKTPLEAMREAERTEQGLLYVDGSGRLVFKDRRSLYNV